MATLTIEFPRAAAESVERMRYLTGVAERKAAPAKGPSLLADIRAWFNNRAERAEELRTLGRMTDRQLLDIGMTRGDVWRLAR